MSVKEATTATTGATSTSTSMVETANLTATQIQKAIQTLQAQAVPEPHLIIMSPLRLQDLQVLQLGMWQARTRRMSTLLRRAGLLVRRVCRLPADR